MRRGLSLRPSGGRSDRRPAARGSQRPASDAATGDARLVDAKALAAHAQDYGVDARLELFPVDAHAFQLFWSFLPEAADAMAAAGAFIRDAAPVHGQRIASERMPS